MRCQIIKAVEAIRKRISVRSYQDKPVDDQLRKELEDYSSSFDSGPFGAEVRFRLLDLKPLGRDEMRRLGTYGVIKGASLYILGAIKEGPGALEDLGYCLEKIILKATTLGLGTCWLAGTFKRSAFAEKMDLAEDELLPAITPVGYPKQGISTADKMLRFSAGSKKRKPWVELFFHADGKTPLKESEAGEYREALEAVRMGPSASNRQPWRIIKGNSNLYHLFLKENKIYNRILGKIRIQNIDMGIAMCHFEMAAQEQGLAGYWDVSNSGSSPDIPPDTPGLQHIATWKFNNWGQA